MSAISHPASHTEKASVLASGDKEAPVGKRNPSGGAIAKRCGCLGPGLVRLQTIKPLAMAATSSASAQPKRSRFREGAGTSVAIPLSEPASRSHLRWRPTSPTDCHRSLGSLTKHVLTT